MPVPKAKGKSPTRVIKKLPGVSDTAAIKGFMDEIDPARPIFSVQLPVDYVAGPLVRYFPSFIPSRMTHAQLNFRNALGRWRFL